MTFNLIKLYAFFISFEHILDVFWEIDTPLKPYRLIGVLIILWSVRNVLDIGAKGVNKYLLLFLFFVFIHLSFKSLISPVSWGGFWNFYIQIIFNALTFLAISSYNWSIKSYFTVVRIFIWGVLLNTLYIVYLYYIEGEAGRLSGFSDDQNSAAFAMSIAVFLILYILKLKISVKRIGYLSGIIAISILVIGILLTGSRSGLLFLFIGVPVVLFIKRLNLANLAIAAIVGGIIFWILTSFLLRSDLELVTRSNSAFQRLDYTDKDIRFDLWSAGFIAFKESGYLGVGMAQFQSDFSVFSSSVKEVNKDLLELRKEKNNKGLGLHSLYFEVLFGTGFIGFILMMLFIIGTIKNAYPKYNTNNIKSLYLAITISFMMLLGIVTAILSGYFWFTLLLISQIGIIDKKYYASVLFHTYRESGRHNNAQPVTS